LAWLEIIEVEDQECGLLTFRQIEQALDRILVALDELDFDA